MNMPSDVEFWITIIGFVLIWAVSMLPTVGIVVFLVYMFRKNKKKDEERFDRAADLMEQKYANDFEVSIPKKILKCEYCGKSVRFGSGVCSNCGGSLPIPEKHKQI